MVEATDIANDTPWTDGDTTAGHFAAGNTAFTGKIDAWYGESSVYVEGTDGYKATCLGMKGREVCEKFRCKLHK